MSKFRVGEKVSCCFSNGAMEDLHVVHVEILAVKTIATGVTVYLCMDEDSLVHARESHHEHADLIGNTCVKHFNKPAKVASQLGFFL